MRDHTFFFADLAGFTALTEAMGDSDAVDLAHEFYAAVEAIVSRYPAETVKAIGDAVMVRSDYADDAIRLALCVVHDVGGRHFFPTVRAGIHTGPAVERSGDWFGATVNLAARVSGEASGNEVLLTIATRDAAANVDGIELRSRGRRELKNVAEPGELYAALREGAATPGRASSLWPLRGYRPRGPSFDTPNEQPRLAPASARAEPADSNSIANARLVAECSHTTLAWTGGLAGA